MQGLLDLLVTAGLLTLTRRPDARTRPRLLGGLHVLPLPPPGSHLFISAGPRTPHPCTRPRPCPRLVSLLSPTRSSTESRVASRPPSCPSPLLSLPGPSTVARAAGAQRGAMASARLAALGAATNIFFLLLLLALGAARAADYGEVRALLALGAALDPTGRLLPSWVPGRDPCSPSGGFEGVACDTRGAVANVSLQGKGLAGTLPPAVAGLRALTGLYLHYNALRGGVPRELAALGALTDLYLNVNNLSGPIPPEIGAMASLQGTRRSRSIRFLGTFVALLSAARSRRPRTR